MSDERDPFELVPDDDKPPEPKVPVEPAPAPESPAASSSYEQRQYERAVERAPGEEVDTRTVAERLGKATPRTSGPLPAPEGWPREALTFPFRTPGPQLLAWGTAALVGLDLIGSYEPLKFPVWVAKLVLILLYLLRAQIHLVGSSAAGKDAPEGWRKCLTFDRDDLTRYWHYMLMFAGLLAPGFVLSVFDQVPWAIGLLVAGSLYASVVTLGAALGDPAVKRPWNALAWITTRPLHCLAGSLGWWVLGLSEIVLVQLGTKHLVVTVFASLVLRFCGLFVLMVSARVIGVMGRAWTP